MQRMQTLALVVSASVFSILAVNPCVAFDSRTEHEAARSRVQPERVRYVQATRGHMGGGLIEALFGDSSPPPRHGAIYSHSYRDYRPAQPQYQIESIEPMRRAPYVRYVPEPHGYQQHAYGAPERAAPHPRYAKQLVDYDGQEKPGTIVIDTPNRFLYLVQDGGKALRYGIGVGRPGFTWAGVKSVSMKKEWPDWRPPAEMLKRRPDLPTFMAGGPENPLGARALYLGSSLYRIHGSNEPWTIGTAVSSGCIRMRNEDVIDLYERVDVGTRVIVI
jgi:lipoprotein-anchoring transpeptidase ErfK/SrfK